LQFITIEKEAILAEWESFARTLRPASDGMSSLELRDHARQILEAIAQDLSTPQTRQEQFDKSRGRAPWRRARRKPLHRPMQCCAHGAALTSISCVRSTVPACGRVATLAG
jgi:hypothetical protein